MSAFDEALRHGQRNHWDLAKRLRNEAELEVHEAEARESPAPAAGSGEHNELEAVYAQLMSCVARGDRKAFLDLFHEEVSFQSATGEHTYQGRQGAQAWWDALTTAPVFQPTVTEARALGDGAWFVTGRLQSAVESGGIADRPAAWVIVLRDGRIWRSQPVGEENEAAAIAASLR
jgi:ketosteroid isomerase-like protein